MPGPSESRAVPFSRSSVNMNGTMKAGSVATEDFEALLSVVPILQLLSAEDLRALAQRARPIFAMPGERLILQGDEGGSLYIVVDGTVEVMLRRDGRDQLVDTMGRGAVFGEMALLTGERRTATVRALDTAVVFEIAEEDYRPLIQAHPEWIDVLARDMADRLRRREARLSMRRRRRVQRISDGIARRFLSPTG